MKKQELLPARKRAKIRAALAKREAVLRAQVRAVVQGYTSALFVWGPGGLGKSHILASELEGLVGTGWQHHTSYTTPKALLLSLAEFPDSIHVFEDCEKMYKTDVSSSILRAACAAPKGKARWVIYETATENLRVNFKGGIIIVSNENIAKGSGPLAAVASRFRPVKWDLSSEERMARMLDIADQGWSRGPYSLATKDCLEVAYFLIEEMRGGGARVPVDLRTFTEHALPAFAQCSKQKGGVDWRDMVRAKLQGEVGQVEKRSEKTSRLQLLASTIAADDKTSGKEKLEKWTQQTGLGKSIYYRHLREAPRG